MEVQTPWHTPVATEDFVLRGLEGKGDWEISGLVGGFQTYRYPPILNAWVVLCVH